MNILQQVLGTNNWNVLSFEMIPRIKSVTSLSYLIANSISADRFNKDGNVRLLSKKKINSILEKVKKEEEFTEETEQFL